MNKLKKAVTFFMCPILAFYLLFLNGEIASKKYEGKDISKMAQYGAIISSDTGKLIMHPGETGKIKLKVKNTGTMTWIPQKEKSISASYHILDNNDKVILQDGIRTEIPNVVKSGEEIPIDMDFMAPDTEGNYKVEVDMVHENVTWFSQKGSKTLFIDLEVKK